MSNPAYEPNPKPHCVTKIRPNCLNSKQGYRIQEPLPRCQEVLPDGKICGGLMVGYDRKYCLACKYEKRRRAMGQGPLILSRTGKNQT